MKKFAPLILFLLSLGLFFFVLEESSKIVGQEFRGYLTFENGVVGAFYVPDWTGPEEGFTYHAVAPEEPTYTAVFSKRDFALVAVLPAASGLLFVLLGLCIFYFLPGVSGRFAMLSFHMLAGIYLILCPDFHLTYRFSYLLMICFAFIPATVIHFGLLFPEQGKFAKNRRWTYALPYIVSFLICIPYLGYFTQPNIWMKVEKFTFSYLIFAYFFWLFCLVKTIRKPQLELNRIVARYLLLGQIIAFTIPMLVGILIFVGILTFPLNFATPMAILFPLSLFLGVIFGKLRQDHMHLLQMEKRAALGNLLAGLAHELNNPITFVYSAIEPLKEMLSKLQSKNQNEETWKDVNELISAMEEGATRSKDMIASFRNFSNPNETEKKSADIHQILDQSIRLLEPKWKQVTFVRHYGNLPGIECFPTEIGQVFVNILDNAGHASRENGNVMITTQDTSDGVQIAIEDSGVGMSKETQSKIFDAFYTTRKQGDGSGLGLAITLEIIKKHGGTIDVKSELSKGTCFIIRLPKS